MVILIAEDDQSVRNLIHLTIDGDGYRVLIASDGTEALDLSRSYEGRIDILISDIRMPRLNGVELAIQLSSERPGIKTLLISGYPGIDVPTEFPLLSKPFSPAALRQAIRELTGTCDAMSA